MSSQVLPERIGPYTILRLLGRGGFGSVYLGQQEAPMRRQVAVKVLNPGMDVAELRERFKIERESLNLMKHPGIAMLLDAGVTDQDQPYFAMEYVPGEPIQEYVASRQLALRERLQLFRSVCDAVQHAHNKGIIHRDLTANNVLVVELDGRPVPKIIDFGIAKSLGASLDMSGHTLDGQTMGTPAYMSPEQARGDIERIDTRTDIYALGVQLYWLLTGTLPFTDEHFARAGVRLLQMICEDDPDRPSTRVARGGRQGPAVTSVGMVKGDLDWIVAKAMAKERDQRYASVASLNEDIRRYLDNEPVSAGPPTTWYRMRKALKRYRGFVTAAAALLSSLVIGLIVSLDLYLLAEENAAEANKNLGRFNRLSDVLLLENLEQEAAELGPGRPGNRARLKVWLERADGLVARLPALRGELAELERPVEAPGEELRARRFLSRALARLVADLEKFANAEDSSLSNVRARFDWAGVVAQRTVDSHQQGWRAAAERVAADERFAGLVLVPQLGLVPLGPDRASGFEEFAVLRSGTCPAREPDRGTLQLTEASAIVLVLVPGGPFELGAVKDEASKRFDPLARENEAHLVETSDGWERRPIGVTLPAFFVSKFEISRAQWRRLSFGKDPSVTAQAAFERYGVNDLCPVESVSWLQGRRVLADYGLDLPTEAQWEYACRAGSDTPWYSGEDEASLAGYENLADITARDARVTWNNFEDVLIEDGFTFTSPIGSYAANAFGLHDMHGNVCERCLDRFGPYEASRLGGPNGLLLPPEDRGDEPQHIVRGGSYKLRAQLARSSYRWFGAASAPSPDCGLRPVRAIDG